jgi:hypothetical protein
MPMSKQVVRGEQQRRADRHFAFGDNFAVHHHRHLQRAPGSGHDIARLNLDFHAALYLAAFAPDAGESLGDIGQASPQTPGGANIVADSDGYVWINPKKFHESFCQDLTTDEALVMAVTQKAPLGSVFGDKVTASAWRTKPSWYQVSSDDRMIAPENEKRMATRMGSSRWPQVTPRSLRSPSRSAR